MRNAIVVISLAAAVALSLAPAQKPVNGDDARPRPVTPPTPVPDDTGKQITEDCDCEDCRCDPCRCVADRPEVAPQTQPVKYQQRSDGWVYECGPNGCRRYGRIVGGVLLSTEQMQSGGGSSSVCVDGSCGVAASADRPSVVYQRPAVRYQSTTTTRQPVRRIFGRVRGNCASCR